MLQASGKSKLNMEYYSATERNYVLIQTKCGCERERARERTQQSGALAALAEDPGLVPSIHVHSNLYLCRYLYFLSFSPCFPSPSLNVDEPGKHVIWKEPDTSVTLFHVHEISRTAI